MRGGGLPPPQCLSALRRIDVNRAPARFYFLLDFFLPPFFLPPFFFPPFFFGTLPPALRASDNPIAIACFLLVTFFPERPLLSFPFFRSCIARLTFFCAVLPYFAIVVPPFDYVDFLAVPFAYCSLLTAYCLTWSTYSFATPNVYVMNTA